MHPNQNFTPLKLFKKHTIESDTYIDSPLAPPTLSNRSQIVKTKDSQKLMQTSTNNQTSEPKNEKAENDSHNGFRIIKTDNAQEILGNKLNNEIILENDGTKVLKLVFPPENEIILKSPKESILKSPNQNSMKGSILKSGNSPKKSRPTIKKVSVKDSPEIKYVEKYQNKGKTCKYICRVF